MEGCARAPGAGTVLNALATRKGCAFAIDRHITANVSLTQEASITGHIKNQPDADTTLIERSLSLTLDRYGKGDALGGHVSTESEIPMASGLKSSSAAANATVLATLAALELQDTVDRLDAAILGVRAARDTGVTVTGAFDDASASMLGGITMTDNDTDELLSHERIDRAVAIHIPPERAYSADADIERCQRIAPVADTIEELANAGRYGRAMTINGFAYAAALEFPTDLMLDALPDIEGVSLSGTGLSTVAIGTEAQITRVAETWSSAAGTVHITETTNVGGHII